MTAAYDPVRLATGLATVTDYDLAYWSAATSAPTPLSAAAEGASVWVNGRHGQWMVSAAEAWERLHLAGLVPAEALDDPRRRFALLASRPIGVAVRDVVPGELAYVLMTPSHATVQFDTAAPLTAGQAVVAINQTTVAPVGWAQPHPARLVDAVAFAAAWPRVVAAEELARQLVARTANVIPQTAPIVWECGKTLAYVQPVEPMLGSLEFFLEQLNGQCRLFMLPLMPSGSPEWRDLLRWGVKQWPAAFDAPCPFAPLLALWEQNVGVARGAYDAITLRWEALDVRPEDYR